MANASNIQRKDGFLVVAGGSFTLDPGSIAAGANEDQTVAVPEARVGDVVIIAPRAVLADGLIMANPLVSATGTITFTLENASAGVIDAPSATWDFLVLRGSIGRFD